MMKRLFYIFILIFSIQAFGQKVSRQKIHDLQLIDTIYSQLNIHDGLSIRIDYKTNKMFFQFPKDTFSIAIMNDSLLIDYCNKNNTSATKFLSLISLMVKNQFISLDNSGVGDCFRCSIIIFYEEKKAFIIQHINEKTVCYPEYCSEHHYYKNEKIKKLRRNISILIK